jgi:GDP-mannose 6-dehydrogenase
MSRSVSVFGLGYVGSVTTGCLASLGNNVIGVDLQPSKVEAINSGKSPVLENRLADLIAEGRRAGRVHATDNTAQAVDDSEISFICVGTPSLRNGQLDVSAVARVCKDIGEALRRKSGNHLVVLRSTVLPGTTEAIVIPALERASGKAADKDFGVCMNPEFLREGTAVSDFFEPPFTVVGTRDESNLGPIRDLYDWVPAELFESELAVAEMVKYMCNGFHALKVAFANEIGTLCRDLHINAQEVTEIFKADTRLNISSAYLTPGFAFGGSCLPKDLAALMYCAKQTDSNLPLLGSILPSNELHLDRAVEMVLRTGRRKVGILGLSFKAGTDDLRESPQVQLAKRLLGEGCQIQIWDPVVALGRLIGSNKQFIEEHIPHLGELLNDSLEEVIDAADLVVLGTPDVDLGILAAHIREDQLVVDLVNFNKADRPELSGQYSGICW